MWRNRILPEFADSFQIKASSDGQFEDSIVSQQTMTIAEDILEIEDHLNRVDQRVRVYLPVGRAIVFDQDISIGSSLLPLRLQNLLMSQKLMNVRMAAFNALLIAGAGLFCYGLHDPSSQLGSGGILLAPAALFLAMFYSPTLLRFSLCQFLSNFMFANVTVLWLDVGLAYPRSSSLNIGYLGLIVWGMVALIGSGYYNCHVPAADRCAKEEEYRQPTCISTVSNALDTPDSQRLVAT
ncbi:Hypothetical Protein FCC1311_011302 [Hondaea fermentalgiana]|uniref:Uncharacterized protein n=1 Tax=Hondaea fermentalgiana TaxID=2315210 RepID=A0A2R5G8V2_9STRA|nr:Hypothetical Protein FCC1311_011302 [Hondaea fermentalgiana]|eukprot:GBG24913.1 Hypothetical Protein FCC1311_011302 [Hondaea fermentalgiana]